MNDLNYFVLDWNQAGEVLAALVLLAIFVERFLAVIFESDLYCSLVQDRHVKEPIAFVVALLVCGTFRFDAVGILMKQQSWSFVGLALTAGVIAGGSKASIKLFVDIMNIRKLNPEEKSQKRLLRQTQIEEKLRKLTGDASSQSESRPRDPGEGDPDQGSARPTKKKVGGTG